jgi:trehalose 6-phosphate synthase
MDGILVCSHRGPYSYQIVDGRPRRKLGNGGVVTASAALLRGSGGTAKWLSCAMSEADRAVANDQDIIDDGDIGVIMLDIPPDVHRRFYDDACNTNIGLLLHGLVDRAYSPVYDLRLHRGWEAYREVSRAYAVKLAEQPGDWPVLVEDYHLMLIADELRKIRRRPGPTAYFHHIVWCSPEYFEMLPQHIRYEILAGLLSFDTIGFHARLWSDAFIACCERFLPGASCEADRISWNGHEVPIVVAPAQVDVPYLQKTVSGEEAQNWRQRFRRKLDGRRALVRVDRADLMKNIIRGFMAFENLVLEESATDVMFLALLTQSRSHLAVNRRYMSACQREARRINQRFLAAGVDARIAVAMSNAYNDHSRALAGLSLADAVLVNSTTDGLNLVAKEAVVASEGRSRLVLSTKTGVYEEIGQWTLGINPFDVAGTTAAIAQALNPGEEWGEASRQLRRAVDNNSPEAWLRTRLAPVL